jgi:hypothetical protein
MVVVAAVCVWWDTNLKIKTAEAESICLVTILSADDMTDNFNSLK